MIKGRKPIPTNLHVLHGNPGKREHPPSAVVVPPKPPALPKYLKGEGREIARAEWRRVVKLLKQTGILSQLDSAALGAYCVSYQRWVEAEAEVRTNGVITAQGPNGRLKQNPYLLVARKAMEQMLRILPEFGMTPSSRARIKQPPADDVDDDPDRIFGKMPE